jgi:rare lipoprotein A
MGREYVVVKLKIVAALLSTVVLAGSHASAEARTFRHGHHHTGHRGHVHQRTWHHHAGRAQGGSLAGMASWYGPGFQGHRTASGERFNTNGLTAAHRSLPLGCRVLVTNRVNGRSVVVRINDRGPFGTGKVIDLSHASAQAIGMSGSAPVSLSRL